MGSEDNLVSWPGMPDPYLFIIFFCILNCWPTKCLFGCWLFVRKLITWNVDKCSSLSGGFLFMIIALNKINFIFDIPTGNGGGWCTLNNDIVKHSKGGTLTHYGQRTSYIRNKFQMWLNLTQQFKRNTNQRGTLHSPQWGKYRTRHYMYGTINQCIRSAYIFLRFLIYFMKFEHRSHIQVFTGHSKPGHISIVNFVLGSRQREKETWPLTMLRALYSPYFI